MAGAHDKIKELELEIRRLMDQNRNYAHELTILSKDIRYKDYEVSQLRSNNMTQPFADTGLKENISRHDHTLS
jgi:hypothetical protein